MSDKIDWKFIAARIGAVSLNLFIWRCILIFAVLFCFGSGIAFAQTTPQIFDAETLSAYKNYDESLVKNLSPLNFESGKTVSTCKEYLDEKKTSAVGETVADTMFHSEYLDCDIVSLLKQSKEANRLVLKKSSKFNYGAELYNRLDLHSFPTSFNDNADDKKTKLSKNLKQNGYWKPKITNLGIESDAKMWSFEIRVIADIDADNDGKRDLILTLAEQAIKEGNYRSYQTLLISDYKKRGYLKARQL